MQYPDNGGFYRCSKQFLRWRAFALLAAGVALAAEAAEPLVDQVRVVYQAQAEFEDVRANVADAILEQGMVISSVSNVGEMLERTGKDLGAETRVFHRAEVLEFCSAVISRQALTADPHSIIYCPYKIAIYALPAAPEQVYLAFPRLALASSDPASPAALGAVEVMLRKIIERALE